MSKAFDKINHNILVKKLVEVTQLSKLIIKMIKYMNENQNVWITFNNVMGDKWKIKNGTRQGEVLSGIIFNFYKNIFKTISELTAGCSIGLYKINILGYADDIILICLSTNGLHTLIDKLYIMLNDLGLILNATKSVNIIFKARKYKDYQCNASIKLNGVERKRVNECKYQGVIIKYNISNDSDVKKCSFMFLKQFNSMYSKFNYVNTDMLKFLLKSYCTS